MNITLAVMTLAFTVGSLNLSLETTGVADRHLLTLTHPEQTIPEASVQMGKQGSLNPNKRYCIFPNDNLIIGTYRIYVCDPQYEL